MKIALLDKLFKGIVEAAKFVTTGGTSSDFVKGDGSLDTTSKNDIAKGVTAHGWGDFRDYGLAIPKYLPNGSPMSDINFTGFSRTLGVGSDFPSGVTSNAFIISNYNNSTIGHQLVISAGSDRIFFRRNINGWQDWVEFFHSRNLRNNTENDARYSLSSHTHTIAQVTNLQTTLDTKALKSILISSGTGLIGGGDLSTDRTISLSTTTQSDIAKGVTAHGWGNHSGKYLPLDSNLTLARDADLMKESGVFVGYQWSNVPILKIGVMTVKRYSGDWVKQTFEAIGVANAIYTRTFYSGSTWSPWLLEYHSGNLTDNIQLLNGAGYLVQSDLVGLALQSWVTDNFDKYDKWRIRVNTEPILEIKSNDILTITQGDGIDIRRDSEEIQISLSSTMPTKTSDLVNDGEDGQSPFISYSDIYTENEIISSNVINVPNTLTYRVSVFEYIIDGVLYNTPVIDDNIVLSPITGNNRIDVIALDYSDPLNHEIVVITGTPAQSPAKPNIDSETQLEITFVIINDGESSPSGVRSKIVYDENLQIAGGEANTYTNFPVDIDFNDTSNAYVGSKSISAINYDDSNRLNRYMEFELDEVFYNEEFDRLVLHTYVDSGQTISSLPVLFIDFVSPSGIVSATNTIEPNSYDTFDEWVTSTAEHSQLTILNQDAYEEGVKKIRINLGKLYNTYVSIDYIFFQGGINLPSQSMHNSLQGLQGGKTRSIIGGLGGGGGVSIKEYYHLTKRDYDKVRELRHSPQEYNISEGMCVEITKVSTTPTRYVIDHGTTSPSICLAVSGINEEFEFYIANYASNTASISVSGNNIYRRRDDNSTPQLGVILGTFPSKSWAKLRYVKGTYHNYFLLVESGAFF